MVRGSHKGLCVKIVRRGGLAAVLAATVVSCNNDSKETTSVQAPLAVGPTDDAFRAAAGCLDCTITARAAVMLPSTGKAFTQVKLMSPSPPTPFETALDGHGNVVNARALFAAEGAAKMARQGKLQDDAYALSMKASSELVPISIWADFGDEHAPREQMLADPAFRATYTAKTAERLHAVTSKVTAWLDARGFKTYERGLDTPVITADVPASALTALGRLDGTAIVHVRHPELPSGTAWFNTVKGPDALTVVGSVALPFCNGEGPQPDSYTYLTPYTNKDVTAPTDWHTTWTTELISATAATRMAPGASPYVASWNQTTSNMYAAWSWCYNTQHIENMNRSSHVGYGRLGLQADDMAQDYYAYHYPYPLITEAAGNCEDANGTLITCSFPGNTKTTYVENRAYNVLIVGASNGNLTSFTSDDYLAGFSQYTNPVTPHGDHELPNLVAPGDDSSGYGGTGLGVASASYSGAGTSASSPIVLGTVLLMKTKDAGFNGWPEMTRATIMTASTHPVNGSRTTKLGSGDLTQGAGLLNAYAALQLAYPSNKVSGPNNPGSSVGRDVHYFNFSTDFPNGVSAPYNISTWSTGRLRVVAAWDATTQQCASDGSGCNGDTPDGDLDLRVSKWTGSSWQAVCSSDTFDSSWELCDVPVTGGGTYKAELVKFSTTASGTWVGLAWNVYNPGVE